MATDVREREWRAAAGLVACALVVVAVGVATAMADHTATRGANWQFPVMMFAALLAVGAGAVWLAGASSRLMGRVLAGPVGCSWAGRRWWWRWAWRPRWPTTQRPAGRTGSSR